MLSFQTQSTLCIHTILKDALCPNEPYKFEKKAEQDEMDRKMKNFVREKICGMLRVDKNRDNEKE